MNEKNLSIYGFTEMIIGFISDMLPDKLMDDLTIRSISVTKPNDNCLHGITFEKEGEDIAPTFYLDDPYQDYLSGEDPDVIAAELAKSYLISLVSPVSTIPSDPDFETIKDHLALRVINIGRNTEFLEDIPYRPISFGLALICDIKMGDGMGGYWRTHVLSSFVDGVTNDTLFDHALANVRNVDPPVLRTSFPATVPEYTVENLLEGKKRIADSEKEQMYVLTTAGGYYGAAAFFYPGIQAQIAEKLGESYYAIPSSVHEFVIIPRSSDPEVKVLEKILKETNELPSAVSDMISEDVFYYDMARGTLSIAIDGMAS